MRSAEPLAERRLRPASVVPRPGDRRRRWGSAVVVLLPALLAVGLVVAGVVTRSREEVQFDAAVAVIDVAGRDHVRGPVAYDRSPPAGGDHAPTWQRCGVYEAAVPDERAVHSLERGAVWITYRPDASEDAVAVLEAYAQSPRVLVSPYPGLPAPFVVTAWGRQLQLTSPNDRRLGAFLRHFQNGPTAPEGDAGCQGGTMQTAP